ncbi:MAG: aliphatic sulfonate ABC transporter substrate-binding protein [Treponema sp.]|jgi:sulfonate transport system substrate-binding protein|nr:aliphatic sulfonate ABC transporter substrate-binding protein [Treponema sp.]
MKRLTETGMVTKSFILVFLSALVATLLLASTLITCNKKSGSDKNLGRGVKTVRVATQPGVFAANILLVKVNGYLEDELKNLGVSVKWDSFAAGPPLNEAFAAGEEDIGLVGDVPLLIAKASGQKTLAFAKDSYGEKTVALTVRTDSAITDLSQLKGKKVAFVKGSYGHHFLGLLLKKAGLIFGDIEQINLPNADIGNTVGSGQADAGIIWEPGLTSNLKNGTVKILIDGTGIKSNSVYFFTTESFTKDNPEILKAYLRALEKANKFIADDPQKTAELLQSEINLPVETLAELLKSFTFSSYISDADIAELKDVEQFNRAEKFSETKVDVDKFIDKSFLESVGITK